MREVFRRYTDEQMSIAEIARWLTERGIPTRTGKAVWDRSTVWGMLRNPAYRGQAAFGKTKIDRAARQADAHRPARRGERHGRRPARHDQPAEAVDAHPRPARSSPTSTSRSRRSASPSNAHFAKRNTRRPRLLQGILVCRECGYACYRTSTRTTKREILLLPLHRPGQLPPRRRARLPQPARSAPTSSTSSSGARSAACSRTPRSSAPRSTVAFGGCAPSTPPPAAARRSSATSPAPAARSNG